MEIKNINAVNAYRTAAFDKDIKNKPVAAAKAKNTDKIEFSTKNDIEGFKTALAKSVDQSATPERISALQNAVTAGTYHIPAESIARAILGE
ncbi:MAG: flagellar biosynthesis anti-sigma factor FlgM [Oscillospiraceae bacterium]